MRGWTERRDIRALAQIIGTHSWFLPALVEKALVLLALGDWEQVTSRTVHSNAQRIRGARTACAYAAHAQRTCRARGKFTR